MRTWTAGMIPRDSNRRIMWIVKNMKKTRTTLLLFLMLVRIVSAAVWQWSVEVPPLPDRQFESPRAYLWIPPHCERVRGIVFGQHNMEEVGVMENSEFRETMAGLGFAEVWVAPQLDLFFRYDQGAGEKFGAMMKGLSEVSGYQEIERAPLVVIGHSAAASLPWIMAAWKPGRIIAGISVSGWYPYAWDARNMPHMPGANFDSVPGLMTSGEYEDGEGRSMKGLNVRKEHPAMPYSYLGCPADGHFQATDEKIRFLAKYVEKAVMRRLPENAGELLRSIDPMKEGWLSSPYRLGRDPGFPAAPVSEYRGKPEEAYWWFDGELARSAEVFQSRHRGKTALLGYVQRDGIVGQNKDTHQQVSLNFEPQDDGVTFTLRSSFLDTVPAGRPEGWTGKKAGESIDVPVDGPPIDIVRICGPVRKTDHETWRIEMDRSNFLGDRRGNEAWLAAVWPGDARWKRAVQQSRLSIPRELKEGTPQEIHFDLPASVPSETNELALKATSTSGMKVRYYVREGPAEVVGETLVFKPVPPRARKPMKVTVVAWQFGRMSEPKIQSARPVIKEVMLE